MASITLRKSITHAAAAVALTLAGGAFVLQTTPAFAASSLEARVQKLEDETAIRNILIQYGHYLDTKDLTSYSNLFAKEGTWTGGIGSAKGPAAIKAMLEKAFANSPAYDPLKVRSFHMMTNFYIQVDGDKATSRSKWTFFGRSPDGKLVPNLSGHYDDTLIREGGQWKILSRTAPHDIPNPEEKPAETR
ncbi:MAG: nuclear transport factor 2 family protein [Gammaproteobacteria bacterium]